LLSQYFFTIKYNITLKWNHNLTKVTRYSVICYYFHLLVAELQKQETRRNHALVLEAPLCDRGWPGGRFTGTTAKKGVLGVDLSGEVATELTEMQICQEVYDAAGH